MTRDRSETDGDSVPESVSVRQRRVQRERVGTTVPTRRYALFPRVHLSVLLCTRGISLLHKPKARKDEKTGCEVQRDHGRQGGLQRPAPEGLGDTEDIVQGAS